MIENYVLTSDELKKFRDRLGLTQEAFGVWLSERAAPKKDGTRPRYSYQRINDFERGLRSIPASVEVIVLRYIIENMRDMMPPE